MSRPLRIEYKDAYYHVMNRGRGRQKVFRGDAYYSAFLETVSEACERFGLEVHAYCLMGNHYHLLVKTPYANLQRAMRHIGSVYTQRYNRIKKTDGPLFRGRYKAIIVDSDAYLLHLSKYIHTNPVAARRVAELEDYPWSSYPAYIGQAPIPNWLFTSEVYGQLGGQRRIKSRYRIYVEDLERLPELEDFYSKGRIAPILGGEAFVARLKGVSGELNRELSHDEKRALNPDLDQILEKICEVFGVDESQLLISQRRQGGKNTARKAAMYLAQRVGGYRLTEIAQAFGLSHYGGVSHAIFSIKQQIDEDQRLAKNINTIINRLDP